MNENVVISSEGDTLSGIAYRHYGSSAGHVERILRSNPKLAVYPAALPAGVVIKLPATEEEKIKTVQTVNLWD